MAILKHDQKSYDDLKKAYDKAVSEGKTQFTYEGEEVLTSYAKYLLEYLKTLL
jgi:hypothetical protein